MDLIGKRVGHYKIIEEIGKGGMGIVFKAVHEKLGRVVAIKMLAPHLSSSEEMRERFLREARLQAELSHPNVVNIFDYIEQDNNVFLVMEYVKGESLDKMLISRGKLTPEETLYIAEGVLQALSFMHKKGIIHRDIKPSNIMISETGIVKVTDFGIARLADEKSNEITKVGTKVGTLYYMAPELIKEGTISPLIDIYALGVTLYQLLTGRVPFIGNTEYEIIQGHLDKEPPPLTSLVKDVPKELVDIVYKALAKNPKNRFRSADEFLESVKLLRSSYQLKSISDSEIRKRILNFPDTSNIKKIFPQNKRKILLISTLVILIIFIMIILAYRIRTESKKNEIYLMEKNKEKVFSEQTSHGGAVSTLNNVQTLSKERSESVSFSEELKKELLSERKNQKEKKSKEDKKEKGNNTQKNLFENKTQHGKSLNGKGKNVLKNENLSEEKKQHEKSNKKDKGTENNQSNGWRVIK